MDEELKEPETPKFIWVKPKESTPEIYGNYVHVSWTLFDVRFQLGRLVPSGANPNDGGFVVEQTGAVTVAWPEAKIPRGASRSLIEFKPISQSCACSLSDIRVYTCIDAVYRN